MQKGFQVELVASAPYHSPHRPGSGEPSPQPSQRTIEILDDLVDGQHAVAKRPTGPDASWPKWLRMCYLRFTQVLLGPDSNGVPIDASEPCD